MASKNILKNWFKNGAKPNENQFAQWMDSYWHKEENITMTSISGLGDALAGKADSSQLSYCAKTNASNIELDAWKEKLDIQDSRFDKFYTKIKSNNDLDYVLKIDGTALEVSRIKNKTFKGKFGNGIDKEFIISHNLSADVIVQVLDLDSKSYKTVDVSIIDENTIKIKTSLTPNVDSYQALIIEI